MLYQALTLCLFRRAGGDRGGFLTFKTPGRRKPLFFSSLSLLSLCLSLSLGVCVVPSLNVTLLRYARKVTYAEVKPALWATGPSLQQPTVTFTVEYTMDTQVDTSFACREPPAPPSCPG